MLDDPNSDDDGNSSSSQYSDEPSGEVSKITCIYCGHAQYPPNRIMDNWTCNYCFSGFVSTKMLLNLIPRDIVTEIATSTSHRRQGRNCIVCKMAMENVLVERQMSKVELNYCRRCRLCWFEGGTTGLLWGFWKLASREPTK